MPVLLQYRLDTRAIIGRWESNTIGIVDAQRVPDDPTYGYLASGTSLGIDVLHAQYYIAEDETLTAKQTLTLTATPTPFAADGVTTCTVSVSPFVACQLLVDGTPETLTEGDQTLILTSDVPHVFQIALVPLDTAWAMPITAEAT